MEKTREYELIRTVEPGVCELSAVHALRRDGGVEVVASDVECVGKKKEVGLRLEERYCVLRQWDLQMLVQPAVLLLWWQYILRKFGVRTRFSGAIGFRKTGKCTCSCRKSPLPIFI
jgi:hypothetical protein